MKKTKTTARKEDQEHSEIENMLNTEQVAKWLGMSEIWVTKARRSLGFPYKKVGSSIRFSPSEVKSWLEKQAS